MTTKLTSFVLASGLKDLARQISIDPKKVSTIRQTVHGTTIISYSGKQQFEVTEPYEKVHQVINQGRA